jgi:uncharacterized membrane protein YfcA
MDFGAASALVDGSFRNPLVVIATLLVTVVVTAVFAVTTWRLSGSSANRSLLVALVGPALVVAFMSPFAVRLVATVLFNWGSSHHFSLCFMPSWHPVRDLGLGACAFLVAGVIVRHRRRRGARSNDAVA